MPHEQTLHFLKNPDFTAYYRVIQNKEHAFVLSILLQWQKDSLVNQRRQQASRVHDF